MKEMPNLICSNAAVGGNFKSTRDTKQDKAYEDWLVRFGGIGDDYCKIPI